MGRKMVHKHFVIARPKGAAIQLLGGTWIGFGNKPFGFFGKSSPIGFSIGHHRNDGLAQKPSLRIDIIDSKLRSLDQRSLAHRQPIFHIKKAMLASDKKRIAP